MSTPIKTSDVTKALAFFVDMSLCKAVDDEGYVCDIVDGGKRTTFGDDKKLMMVYQERIPSADIYVINPFADGTGDTTPPQRFFYRSLRRGLNMRLAMVALCAMKMVLTQNGKTVKAKQFAPPDVPPTKAFLDIVSGTYHKNKKLVDAIDERAFEAIENYLSIPRTIDFLAEIIYTRKRITSDLEVDLISKADFYKTIGLEEKHALVLVGILKNILKVKTAADLKKLSVRANLESQVPARLGTYLGVLFKTYGRFNDALDDISAAAGGDDSYSVDMGAFKIYLDNLDAYAGNAKWMTQAAAAPEAHAPAGVPNVGQVIPTLGAQPPASNGVPPNIPSLSPMNVNPVGPGYVPGRAAVPSLDAAAGIPTQPSMRGNMMMPAGQTMVGNSMAGGMVYPQQQPQMMMGVPTGYMQSSGVPNMGGFVAPSLMNTGGTNIPGMPRLYG